MFNLLKKINQIKVNPRLYIGGFLLIGLLLTLFVWRFSIDRIEANRRKLFEKQTDILKNVFRQQLVSYTDFLGGISSLLTTNPDITYDSFSTFVKNLKTDKSLPGIFAVSFTQNVAAENITSFVNELRSQPSEAYDFTLFNLFPKSDTATHFINKYVYLESASIDQTTLLGRDLGSDKVLNKTILTARDTGQPSRTDLIPIFTGKTRPQPGLMVSLPVYLTPLPPTKSERQPAFAGTVNGLLLVNDLFWHIFKGSDAILNINFEIWQNSATLPADLVYTGISDNFVEVTPPMTQTLTVDVWGKEWILKFTALPEFGLTKLDQRLPYLVLLAGFDLTLLLSLLMYLSVLNRERISTTYKKLLQKWNSQRT